MAMIKRKTLKKWLFISALCSAHSFFWGASIKANLLAMVLAILSLALLFAFIESHAWYQAKRANAPRFARALDAGVRFRCWLGVYIPISVLVAGVLGKMGSLVAVIFGAPYMAELFIGMGALSLTQMLTGINLSAGRTQQALSMMENFVATYLTSIYTGLAHTIILGVICLAAYGVVRIRDAGRAKTSNSSVNE